MMKIINFSINNKKKKINYSEDWLNKICTKSIAEFIQRNNNYKISWRASIAIAEAKIAIVYRDLVLEEEKENLYKETIEG